VTLTITDARAEDGGRRCHPTTRIDRHAAGVTAGRGIIARGVDVEIEVYATH
jgi:hypothetical protein